MNITDDAFRAAVDADYAKKAPDLSKTLNILVVGKVSAGKSSLINSLFERAKSDPIARVGARAGVTTSVQVFALDEHVCVIDSPGLDDVVSQNSEVTTRFLESIDVAIFVVTGAVDASQKGTLETLRKKAERTFVVLNKIDEWDRLAETALVDVVGQWKQALNVERIYPTCTFGYDPTIRDGVPIDDRGIAELRADVRVFIESEGKDLLLARHMGDKRAAAQKIILGAIAAVAAEAFLPVSAVLITATQAASLGSLYYIYTGRVLSRANALAILPTFASQSIGSNLFLWAKSMLPPTGIIDVAAAGVAVTVTASMLLTVDSMLAAGSEIEERTALKGRYGEMGARLNQVLAGAGWKDLGSADFWRKVLHGLMYS